MIIFTFTIQSLLRRMIKIYQNDNHHIVYTFVSLVIDFCRLKLRRAVGAGETTQGRLGCSCIFTMLIIRVLAQIKLQLGDTKTTWSEQMQTGFGLKMKRF